MTNTNTLGHIELCVRSDLTLLWSDHGDLQDYLRDYVHITQTKLWFPDPSAAL